MMGKGSELSRDGDWSVLRVWGEVDLSWSQDVRKQVLDAYTKAKSLAVQLDGVSYIDSSGIAALVEGFQHARAKGGRFALLAPSESVRAVLELARLDRVFPIFSDLAAARAA
ncbi:MAG: STAS domain-containing protein [Xanthomonadales bacterium]|nr:STAS domain-containing protein [Xanthomonadales bacterium]